MSIPERHHNNTPPRHAPRLALLMASTLAFSQWASAAEPTRSTNIAITSDDSRLINLNHDTGTVTVFRINANATGQQALTKLAEIGVGDEPNCVAIHPTDSEAYVTTADGFVSVISLEGASMHTVVKKIAVQAEPRGCALTPTGNILYVANHTAGTVSAISTPQRKVLLTSKALYGRPYALAVTNDGDTDDRDERVYVTDFFAARETFLDQPDPAGFDNTSYGVVRSFTVGDLNNPATTRLEPLADSGFTADRSKFCLKTNASLHPAAQAEQPYCPDTSVSDPLNPKLAADPQGAYPNQLHALLIRGNRLFVPSIGAAPEPPVQFRVNVQALVGVIDTVTRQEIPDGRVNLNAQIKTETQPTDPATSLARVFGNDIVAIDANPDGTDYLIASRGGNYVLRAKLSGDKLDIGASATTNAVRLQTGHLPTGVAISRDGSRAYTNNEVGRSVSVLNLATNKVVVRDILSSALPQVGSFEHNLLMGKLVFFTALGVPDNGLSGMKIQDIDPLKFRGKASDNGWSSCGSCHPAGLADGVTWVFPNGPRQTIPLDSTYSKRALGHDTRILNWSAVRGSNTDFNNNSRGVQGGIGFAGNPPNANIFDHGITQGASEALDLQTLFIQSIRTFSQPQTTGLAAGAAVFQENCASCHGGAKWTKSQILYRDNPALVAAGGAASDPGLVVTGGQIQSYTANGKTLNYLEDVDTFSADDPLEIKGAGGAIGGTATGKDGFNVPSLLGLRYNAPYFHDGSALTLAEVFAKHGLGGGTIAGTLTATERGNLQKFLNALDGKTATMRSAADIFRDPVAIP